MCGLLVLARSSRGPRRLSAAASASASGASTPPSDIEQLPLGAFTINIPGGSRRASYVVIDLTIEATKSIANQLRERTPRLREAVLRRLMTMAQRGQLQPARTDLLVVKDQMVDAISRVQNDGVRDVLVTRLLHS